MALPFQSRNIGLSTARGILSSVGSGYRLRLVPPQWQRGNDGGMGSPVPLTPCREPLNPESPSMCGTIRPGRYDWATYWPFQTLILALMSLLENCLYRPY